MKLILKNLRITKRVHNPKKFNRHKKTVSRTIATSSISETSNSFPQTLLDISLVVNSGEIHTIMGTSGSGKSTLLKVISGIHDTQNFAFSGNIFIDEQEITSLAPHKRHVGMMVQDFLLFPHLKVEQNLMFGMESDFPDKSESATSRVRLKTRYELRHEKIKKAFNDIQLSPDLLNRYPDTLSGGQIARVALMRTLLSNPKVLLLDEPFSRLDTVLRAEIRSLIKERVIRLGIPTLLVTHDKEDILQDEYLLFVGDLT